MVLAYDLEAAAAAAGLLLWLMAEVDAEEVIRGGGGNPDNRLLPLPPKLVPRLVGEEGGRWDILMVMVIY